MSAGFAKKIGMTRLFIDSKSVPVTAIQFESNTILQKKENLKNKTFNIQIGAVKKKSVSKASLGHAKKHADIDDHGFRFISEFEFDNELMDKKSLEITDFSETDLLKITGVTIGKGFAGVVKRWHFAGQPASHGHDHNRAAGSIGSRWPQRVTKGKKMPGHLGAINQTFRKVRIVAIDNEKSLIFIKGSLPGANSSYLKISKEVLKAPKVKMIKR